MKNSQLIFRRQQKKKNRKNGKNKFFIALFLCCENGTFIKVVL